MDVAVALENRRTRSGTAASPAVATERLKRLEASLVQRLDAARANAAGWKRKRAEAIAAL